MKAAGTNHSSIAGPEITWLLSYACDVPGLPVYCSLAHRLRTQTRGSYSSYHPLPPPAAGMAPAPPATEDHKEEKRQPRHLARLANGHSSSSHGVGLLLSG